MSNDKEGIKEEVDETTDQNVPTGETNEAEESVEEEVIETKEDDTSDSSASDEETNEEIDYEAELGKEQEARKKAESKIVDMKRANKKEDSEESQPDDVKALLDSKVSEMRQEILSDVIEEALESVSDNAKEKELIRFHYENSIKTSGYSRTQVVSDIQRAYLLANESRLIKENRELRESLKSKNSLSNTGRGTNQDRLEAAEGTIEHSSEDLEFMKKRGMDPKKITN